MCKEMEKEVIQFTVGPSRRIYRTIRQIHNPLNEGSTPQHTWKQIVL